ncbi:MAG TPA: branched-chain amino acid ABC transporter permease [Alphaproteobacteria bacterium]|jgi:branched-chain amino acid transport system permease protein
MRRALIAAAAVAALVVIGRYLPSYYTGLLTLALIYGIFAMSLDLLLGYTGLPSLGHAAYFGSAAYVAALIVNKLGAPFAVAIPAGLLAAVTIAALFNLLALRTVQGYYLMITLALSQVLWSLAVSWRSLTGGDDGMAIPRRPDFGSWLGVRLDTDYGYFIVVLAVFLACLAAMRILVASPFGYALLGIRENESRMRALGYNAWAYKYVVSLIAGLFAGIAGELYAFLHSFISPATLSIDLSAQVLLMVLVGAAGTLWGPIFGAFVLVILQNIVSTYTDRWLFVVGAIYVLIAMFAPKGLFLRWRDRAVRALRQTA